MQVHRKKCMTMYIEFKKRMTPGWRDQRRNSVKSHQSFRRKLLRTPRSESVGNRTNLRDWREKSMKCIMNPIEHGARPVWPDVVEPNITSLQITPKMP